MHWDPSVPLPRHSHPEDVVVLTYEGVLLAFTHPCRSRRALAVAAVAAIGGTMWGAGNAAAWQEHEGEVFSNVSLSNTGQLAFTLNNPTAENIRCTVHFFTWESEPEIRAAVARVDELAAQELDPANPDDFEAILELSQAIDAVYPADGELVDTYFGVAVPGEGSREYGHRLDAPIQDRYVGYSYCDTFSTSPVQDWDVSIVTVSKDTGSGAGGGFGSVESLLR